MLLFASVVRGEGRCPAMRMNEEGGTHQGPVLHHKLLFQGWPFLSISRYVRMLVTHSFIHSWSPSLPPVQCWMASSEGPLVGGVSLIDAVIPYKPCGTYSEVSIYLMDR
mmetsp:Transcript_17269/g.23728  ORF Transcript_17269/g.23728 Transcript_17269/m.23728 type:complete len:109 (-) Transcript_17269:702-1028(-)